MSAAFKETPVTQILSFAFQQAPTTGLRDDGLWAKLIDLCEKGFGVQRIYWGHNHEHPEHAQLHIVRQTLEQHKQFLGSGIFEQFLAVLEQVTGTPRRPTIRHAQLKSWGPDDKSLARGAPFSGTAIYLNTTDAWDEGAWPLWTHIVRHVDGCLGGAGGPLLEPVETIPGPFREMVKQKDPLTRYQRCNVVYVGWETTKQHDDFHHTQHFADHFVILNCVNDGFAEYGHIVFEGSREYSGGRRDAKL